MSNKKPSGKGGTPNEGKTPEPQEKADLVQEPGSAGDDLQETVERFAKEAEKLACELAAEKDKYLRIAAEYDNFRKRSQKERENIYSDIRGDTLLRFLPVYDNLERALKQETEDEAYYKGVDMIMTQFKEIMTALGVTEIQAEAGGRFDPVLHDAVMHIEDETLGEGVIVEQFQKGFKLGDRVLRFSVVKVAN